MGYCYQGRRLCCDICGEAGAKKMRCPHGYCQPIACCDRDLCRDKLRDHRRKVCKTQCKPASDKYAMRESERKAMLADGKWLRCAALSVADDRVHVLFENASRQHVGRYMKPETYHAYPLLENRTIEDYEAVGELFEAPASYY